MSPSMLQIMLHKLQHLMQNCVKSKMASRISTMKDTYITKLLAILCPHAIKITEKKGKKYVSYEAFIIV